MPPSQPIASKLPMKLYGANRKMEWEDMAHRKRLRICALSLCIIILASITIGYWTMVWAQEASKQALTTQVAVNTEKIHELDKDDASTHDDITALALKVDAISDRISTMQGIGGGVGFALVLLQTIAIWMQVSKQKKVYP